MTLTSLPARPTSTIPRPELHVAGKACIAFLVLLGAGALAGGVALVTRPDGSVMDMSVANLAGSPFVDYLVPGLVLGGLFGIGSLIVAAMGVTRRRLAPFLAFAIGCGQMVWITVELSVIKEVSFLQPLFFLVGLVIAATAVPWGWPTFAAWRAVH